MSIPVILLTVLLLVQAGSAGVLPAEVRKAADRITAAQLEKDLAYFASDELKGRNTPSPGFDLAAAYIVKRLEAAGVKPRGDKGTFYQRYEMHESRVDPAASSIRINGITLRLDDGFVLRSFSGQPLKGTWPVVYVGHGWVIPDKGIDPYAGLDVRGKIVLTHGPRAMPKDVTIQQFGRVTVGASNVVAEAAKRGAAAVLMIPQTSAQPGWWQQLQGQNLVRKELDPWVPSAYAAAQVTSALLSREAVDGLMAGERVTRRQGIVAQGDALDYPASFELSKRVTFNIPSTTTVHRPYNVVAFIEGTDPVLKNEYITVEAHLDGSVGTRTVDGDAIYNSADDNASGSAAALAIAERMMAVRPKRSMIFIWDSGEEQGLWGTRHFVANSPVPFDRIVAHFNIDMIGATRAPGTADAESADIAGPNEVYLIGPGVLSDKANALIERVNQDYLKMRFNRNDDRWDSEFFYPRTDAGPFLERGVLTIGWNTGLHRRYHLPSDEAKFLDPKKMEAVARTVFATLWVIADSAERPGIDKPIPVSVPRHK